MGRHRHALNVRADGLGVVLGSVLRDERVEAALLVDAGSGMVLDACCAGPDGPDPEVLGAAHADVVRAALAAADLPVGPGHELVLGVDGARHHLLRTVPDPHGDQLVLALVVNGPRRALERVRRRLRAVPVEALTAGPSVTRRPVDGRWTAGVTVPLSTAGPDRPAPRAAPAVPVQALDGPAAGDAARPGPAVPFERIERRGPRPPGHPPAPPLPRPPAPPVALPLARPAPAEPPGPGR